MSRPRIHLITLITKTAEFKKSEQKKRRINYHDMQVNMYFEFNWIFAHTKKKKKLNGTRYVCKSKLFI